jgi:D-serine deaminase-like pyridoxal phosphate-dependent protein
MIGQTLDKLDSPQLLLDLDLVDSNLALMQEACRKLRVNLRVHFKSLKCGGLARYLKSKGIESFLCAKLNEAETLRSAGIRDIFIANEIVGLQKLNRVAELAKVARVSVCVDDAENISALGLAAQRAGVAVGALIEVDIGMRRCGVEPGEPAVALAQRIASTPGLEFRGLQGYDGHIQMLPDAVERRKKCLAAFRDCARKAWPLRGSWAG